jgi:transcriptional regulator with XRE-family HTH domain
MPFEKTVKALCSSRGWTLSRLSKESGVPLSTLHRYTTGRKPDLEHLRKIAGALEVSLYRLAFDEADPHEELDEQILQEIFSGDIRVTVQRIQRSKSNRKK